MQLNLKAADTSDANSLGFPIHISEYERQFITAPQRISYESFNEALNVLPPENWRRTVASESFKMCEYHAGQVTSIYARVGNEYYSFRDMAGLTHEQIVAKIVEPKV